MTQNSLIADGVKLDTHATVIGPGSNRWSVPGAIGDNVSVPARHGSLWVADKSFDEASFKLAITVLGEYDTGIVPADELIQTRTNIDTLLRIFTKRKKLIHFQQTMDDGTAIECYAECTGAFDVTRTSSALPYAQMNVAFNVPDAFWQDQLAQSWSSIVGVAPADDLLMEPLAGGTAPMADLVWLFHGPASGPELRVVETGAYVRLNRTLAEGETWRIDSAAWTSTVGDTADVTLDGGGTSAIADTVHGGSASFIDLPPFVANTRPIEVQGTGFGAATQIEARGRRKYMIG